MEPPAFGKGGLWRYPPSIRIFISRPIICGTCKTPQRLSPFASRSHLLEDMPFISANRELMGGGSDGVTRCLLVTTRNIKGGLLVDGQGYDYARYTAEVLDKSVLDLREVPTDHYDLTLQQPRPGPER